MGKLIFFCLVTAVVFSADRGGESSLSQACLACHREQNIPSEMIYRRYLLKYSSRNSIKEEMYRYLTNPAATRSIMPPQFFKKFPVKKAATGNRAYLKKMIERYILYFDTVPRIKIIYKEPSK